MKHKGVDYKLSAVKYYIWNPRTLKINKHEK